MDLFDLLKPEPTEYPRPDVGDIVRYNRDPMLKWGHGRTEDDKPYSCYLLEGQIGKVIDHTAWDTEDEEYVNCVLVSTRDFRGRDFCYWAWFNEVDIISPESLHRDERTGDSSHT